MSSSMVFRSRARVKKSDDVSLRLGSTWAVAVGKCRPELLLILDGCRSLQVRHYQDVFGLS